MSVCAASDEMVARVHAGHTKQTVQGAAPPPAPAPKKSSKPRWNKRNHDGELIRLCEAKAPQSTKDNKRFREIATTMNCGYDGSQVQRAYARLSKENKL